LGATQLELRKLGSERHTLRSRLRREADRVRELESALRAEKELHAQASDEHFVAIVGLRARLSEIEAERDEARRELCGAQDSIATLHGQLDEARTQLEIARSTPADSRGSVTQRAAKSPQGLRRIRGIGPAYARVLEAVGVTRVQQVAAWTDADVRAFAEKLKIKPERIVNDDWVGQASVLDPDPE
jgi:predicted flap endonuclease-1-like 5' DNA nuclease